MIVGGYVKPCSHDLNSAATPPGVTVDSTRLYRPVAGLFTLLAGIPLRISVDVGLRALRP